MALRRWVTVVPTSVAQAAWLEKSVPDNQVTLFRHLAEKGIPERAMAAAYNLAAPPNVQETSKVDCRKVVLSLVRLLRELPVPEVAESGEMSVRRNLRSKHGHAPLDSEGNSDSGLGTPEAAANEDRATGQGSVAFGLERNDAVCRAMVECAAGRVTKPAS